MTAKSIINDALKQAMLTKNESQRNTLRLLLTGIKLAEVERGEELDDASIFALIQKEIKMRKESIEGAQRGGRADLIAQAEQEILILEHFLPKALSQEELTNLVKETISEIGASGPADTGKVMKALMPKIQGRAAGDVVSQTVRNLLQG